MTATQFFSSPGMMTALTGPPDEEGPARAPARTRIATPPLLSAAGAQAFGNLVATAPTMSEVFAVMRRLAPTDITLTVIGETGTGKDVVAHAVHDASSRAGGPFIVFDCGAVPANLVETELFGHERGAFTGAHAEHVGAFERARGGTLFLDEIGELPLDLQPRLLRALESRSIRRVGGTRDARVDLRIVAATNRDLAALVANRTFRQDLYFRLAAAVVQLPPLRERREDIPLLVPRLLADLGRPEVTVSDATLELLRAHPWPGNVRELKNVLACALAFVDAGVLEPVHLRFVASTGDHSLLDRLPLGGHTLASVEQSAIKQTLVLTRGNKVHAARMLGIAASTLYEKLKKYSL
ncbi:MAG TPA: sigma-54 dependent transcriptional regulator [Polyangia bacterium]|nr:sigma-54 dependent transcriptional regulator [Polyangia bacterium]